jgi:chitinase
LLYTGYVCSLNELILISYPRQGQGAGQQRLSYFCAKSTVDVIPIAFVDVFPAQGNGFPGTNFGNQCWGPPYVYPGPGNNPSLNQLLSECPNLIADIPICQGTYSKKIVLSLGGASQTYQLTGASNGVAFADFLWGAFGPQTPSWLASVNRDPSTDPTVKQLKSMALISILRSPQLVRLLPSQYSRPANSI